MVQRSSHHQALIDTYLFLGRFEYLWIGKVVILMGFYTCESCLNEMADYIILTIKAYVNNDLPENGNQYPRP